MEFNTDINDTEKQVKIRSLKGREAQRLWNKLKEFEKLKDEGDEAIEASEKFKKYMDDLIVEYSNLNKDDLDEITVDDRVKCTDFFIEQAQKHIIGFSTASQKQEN